MLVAHVMVNEERNSQLAVPGDAKTQFWKATGAFLKISWYYSFIHRGVLLGSNLLTALHQCSLSIFR